MKILQLSPQLPFPPDSGGKIGIYNILRELSKNGANITLFAFTKEKPRSEHINYLQKLCTPIPYYYNTRNTIPKIIKYFLLNRPIFTEKYFTLKVKKDFDKLLPSLEFDLIHVDHTSLMSLGIWLKNITHKPLGLFLHNIEWIIWQRFLDKHIRFTPSWLFLKQQTGLLRTTEAEYISLADINFVLTESDYRRAKELSPKGNVLVVPFGMDLNLWQIDSSIQRNPHEIVFATTYSWYHNVQGLKWFLEKVFPIVLETFPQAILTILGKNPPLWLKKYNNINVEGYVDKVQPYYNRANLSISPLFVGGGVRIKILEAMAMGLPVVSTVIGAEGITATNNEGLFISDDPKKFAEAIIYLLNNFDEARNYGNKARQFIEKHHSATRNCRVIFDKYKEIIENAK